MSDRTKLFILQTGGPDHESVELYMDGESGTWRLFFETNSGDNVDFSRQGLEAFVAALNLVVASIRTNPKEFDAELRRSWQDE